MDASTKKIVKVAGFLTLTFGVLFVGSKLMKAPSGFDYVISKGAKPFKTSSGQEGYTLNGYQFYSNGRVMEVSSKRMGSYDRKDITWDDGKEQKMSEIIK